MRRDLGGRRRPHYGERRAEISLAPVGRVRRDIARVGENVRLADDIREVRYKFCSVHPSDCIAAGSVLEPGVVRLLCRRARCAERADAALGQHRNETQEHLGGDERVAERRVPSDHVHAQPRGDLLEAVRRLLRDAPPPTAAACRAPAARTARRSAPPSAGESACRTPRCARPGPYPRRTRRNARQHRVDRRLPGEHVARDPVTAPTLRAGSAAGRRATRSLACEQPAVEDAHRADRDDLVALGRPSPVVSVSNTVYASASSRRSSSAVARRRPAEEVEIVELRTARRFRAPAESRAGRRHRQQQAEVRELGGESRWYQVSPP